VFLTVVIPPNRHTICNRHRYCNATKNTRMLLYVTVFAPYLSSSLFTHLVRIPNPKCLTLLLILHRGCYFVEYFKTVVSRSGQGIVVGMATGYSLGGTGIKSRWGRDFPHLSRPALWPTHPPVQWVPGLSRG